MGGHRGTGERKAEREAKAMKVSVVILNWNGCDMLRTFLPSVVRYSKGEGVEVCVADNGSTDASVEMLRQDFPSVRVILLDQNHGFADGYNLALQQVEADYVVLLNILIFIRKLLPANRKYGAGGKKIILNMLGRQVAFWINMVIPFVVDV